MSIKLFTNLLVYRFTQGFSVDPELLNEALASKPARVPAANELSTAGFIEPITEGEYVEVASRQALVFSVAFAERMLPGKIVRREVDARVREIEKDQNRKVYAREKQQLKDAVVQKLLPRAFVDQRTVYCAIIGQHIFIDSSSAKRGEMILSMLREALGSLPVRPVAVSRNPIESYTNWFTDASRPEHFTLTGDFKANSSGDEFDFVNGKGTSPDDQTLSDLVLEAGRRVTLLGLVHHTEDHSVPFTVNEMLGIKGVKWPDDILETANRDAGEDAEKETLLRATLLLLTEAMHDLLHDLFKDLGGEEMPQGSLEESVATIMDALKHALPPGAKVVREDDEEEGLI